MADTPPGSPACTNIEITYVHVQNHNAGITRLRAAPLPNIKLVLHNWKGFVWKVEVYIYPFHIAKHITYENQTIFQYSGGSECNAPGTLKKGGSEWASP